MACVPTGVKHLHHKAVEYDIGIYFEANGHGTVTFSDLASKLICNAANAAKDAKDSRFGLAMYCMFSLIVRIGILVNSII